MIWIQAIHALVWFGTNVVPWQAEQKDGAQQDPESIVAESIRGAREHRLPKECVKKLMKAEEKVVPLLVKKLDFADDDPEKEEVAAAVWTILVEVKSGKAIPLLLDLLESKSVPASGRAYDILQRVPVAAEYSDRLLKVSADDKRETLQAMAIHLLALMGEPRVAVHIKKVLEKGTLTPEMQEFCLECLSRVQDTDYLKELVKTLSNSTDDEALKSYQKFLKLRSTHAIKYLMPILSNERFLRLNHGKCGSRHCDLALYAVQAAVEKWEFDETKAGSGYNFTRDELNKWKAWWEKHKDDAEYR